MGFQLSAKRTDAQISTHMFYPYAFKNYKSTPSCSHLLIETTYYVEREVLEIIDIARIPVKCGHLR